MTVTLERSVEEFIGSPRQLFINGQWVDSASGRTFDTPNPATGETLARIAEGDAEDINRAVRAARKAFEEGPWSRMTPSERGRIIWRIGDLILQHVDELAQLESLDNGKPFAVARGADVPLADIAHTVNLYRSRHNKIATVSARDRAELVAGLRALAAALDHSPIADQQLP